MNKANIAEVLAVRSQGTYTRLTFRPVSRNRLVCNQLPKLGHLTSNQADQLRGQVWPKHRQIVVTTFTKKPPTDKRLTASRGHPLLLAGVWESHELVFCPHCGNPDTEYRQGIRTCWHCRKKYRVVFPA